MDCTGRALSPEPRTARLYVDGSIVPPSQTVVILPEERSGPRRITVNPEYTQLYHQDQMIFSALNSSLEEEALGHVAMTSGDVWCILQNNFASSSRTRIMQIRMQLASMQKKDLIIADYYSKMKHLADTLSAIGKPLQDEEFLGSVTVVHDT
jgi:hypothetical protein